MTTLVACALTALPVAVYAFRVSGPSVQNDATAGAPLPPSAVPPFEHWDLREFPSCTVPWSPHDGTLKIPGLDEFLNVENGFSEWEAVLPSVIAFTRVPLPGGAKCPLLFDGNNAIGWDGINCTNPTDDVWDAGVPVAQRACLGMIAPGSTLTGPGVDGWRQTNPNNCPFCTGADDQIARIIATGQLVVEDDTNGIIETTPTGDDVWDAAVPVAQRHCNGVVPANAIIIRDPPGGNGRITSPHNCCDDRPGPNGTTVDGGNGLITTNPAIAKIPDGVLAVTATFDVTASGKTLEADILFNNDYNWNIFPHDTNMNRQPDVWTVAMHEIGHFVGLHHPPGRGLANPPGPIMNPIVNSDCRRPNCRSNHFLGTDDIDALNFLYTPDLGDAPDPFIATFNEYPTLVHAMPTARVLNGIDLHAPGAGAEHLFGIYGEGRAETPILATVTPVNTATAVTPTPTPTPALATRYQYEWLGPRIDDHPGECEARVPDNDAFDDGVVFGGIFVPGGGPVPVKITVNTARDLEGRAHCYALGSPMYLNGWFDWNADGDWSDPGEHVIGAAAGDVKIFAAGTYTFNVTAPAGALPGGYARFRLDWGEDVGQPIPTATGPTPTSTVPSPTPTGPTPTITCSTPAATPPPRLFGRVDPTLNLEKGAAQFGEVEDYPLQVSTLDHFQCYESHGQTRIISGLQVTDQFGPSIVTATQPHRLCNPADKNNEDPFAPFDVDHLTGYKMKQTLPHFTRITGQVIVNQFGTIVVDLVRPDYLFVPSAKSRVAPPPPFLNPTIDHFKCYKVRAPKFRASAIQVDDQFGTLLLDVKKPMRLCAPADKNGSGVLDAATHLMCYKVRIARSSPPFNAAGIVYIDNQFGPDQFPVFRPTELCVPSLKNPG